MSIVVKESAPCVKCGAPTRIRFRSGDRELEVPYCHEHDIERLAARIAEVHVERSR